MRLDEEARDGIALGLGDIAVEAGRLLQGFEQRREFRTKADGSPTTPADLAAEELILRRLAEAWPQVPAVAEETANAAAFAVRAAASELQRAQARLAPSQLEAPGRVAPGRPLWSSLWQTTPTRKPFSKASCRIHSNVPQDECTSTARSSRPSWAYFTSA